MAARGREFSEDTTQEPPLKLLGEGLSPDLLTHEIITIRTRELLREHPAGFIGALTPEELAVIIPQIDYKGLSFAPGVIVKLIKEAGKQQLHLSGMGMIGNVPIKEVEQVLENRDEGGVKVVTSKGIPFPFTLALSRVNSLLEAGMSKVVGAPVTNIRIGERYLTAAVGVPERAVAAKPAPVRRGRAAQQAA